MIIFRQVVKESRWGLPCNKIATTIVANSWQKVSCSSYHRWIGKDALKSSSLTLLQKQTKQPTAIVDIHGNPQWRCLQWSPVRSLASSTESAGLHHPHLSLPTTIKPWKIPMIESNGDYRDEAFLEREDEIAGPLYRNQASLPRLPVPTLEDTIERFLPTALPLARNEQEKEALKYACEIFPREAQVLQERLLDRANNEMKNSSYLQLYWNQLGYLQVRDSVVVNVSYFFQFQNDGTISKDKTANIQRAAAMLYMTAEFRKKVCSGAMEPEVLGKAQIPLDATAFKYMFHACRIPRKVQDTYRICDPSRYSHAVVARKGNFFAVDIVDQETGNPLSLPVIEKQLQQCIDMADKIPSSNAKLGILTSTNRDTWADARAKLLQLGGKSMEKALEILESGALLVNLDDTSLTDDVDCSEMMLTGRKESGDNRWFDKSIQIVVDNNGQAGTLSEHSMMDGMPVVKFADYITGSTYEEVQRRSMDQETNDKQSSHNAVDIFKEALKGIDSSLLNEMESRGMSCFELHIRWTTTLFSFLILPCTFHLLSSSQRIRSEHWKTVDICCYV
jgi:hypothetical protein